MEYVCIHSIVCISNITCTLLLIRFDERRKLEPERKLKGKKRSFRDNFGNHESEKVSHYTYVYISSKYIIQYVYITLS